MCRLRKTRVMRRVVLPTAALCFIASLFAIDSGARATEQRAAPSRVAHGRQVYVAEGCYQCHGYSGQGTSGPRLAPNPLPIELFTRQLRNPLNVMPVYTRVVLPDADLADIYAYLNSVPGPKSVAEIPLLR